MALKRESSFSEESKTKRVRQDQEYYHSLNFSVVITDQLSRVVDLLERCSKARIASLLLGPPSSGKSTCIDHFLAQREHVFYLDVSEQTDAKALLGTHVASAQHPGQFSFVPGLLSRAALLAGSVLIIEDLHLASLDVMSVLLPIVQRREIFSPAAGEMVPVAEDFQLIATSSVASLPASLANLLDGAMHIITLEPIADLTTIMQQRYQLDASLCSILMALYARVSDANPKALFRLCSRLSFTRASQGLDEQSRENVLLEAYDCFGAHLVKLEDRQSLMSALASALHLSQVLEVVRMPKVEILGERVQVGRVVRQVASPSALTDISMTSIAAQTLERIAISVELNEPVLLVGETGTGKTTLVQQLARLYGGIPLSVLNMSQQTEAADLVGGFKPVSAPMVLKPLVEDFDRLFRAHLPQAKNAAYLTEVYRAFESQQFDRLLKLMKGVLDKLGAAAGAEWSDFARQLAHAQVQLDHLDSHMMFGFVEGELVKALRNGSWILLDELNLATAETIEFISAVLKSAQGSVTLVERGDAKAIQRHPDFRIFACMNPATDAAKRDLPASVRGRFVEIFVDETDSRPSDLRMIIDRCIGGMPVTIRDQVTQVYYGLKTMVKDHVLVDGNRRLPLLNLRTLTRALLFANKAQGIYGPPRALMEGFTMAFVTGLDEDSARRALTLIQKGFGLSKLDPLKRLKVAPGHLCIEGFVVPSQTEALAEDASFILTPSVKLNIAKLCRAMMAGPYPILLEGPTSAGKTSSVEYVARLTGHQCVRINNHEHTDIQEYLGSYRPDPNTGKLAFMPGLLVQAVKEGRWIILDELNLAPSDVLEALNRLLDDNRELFVPEIGETIKSHPNFRLFATQNPAGALYGGRKMLSRAFRSRFLEIQFPELSLDEVETILEKRCQVAPSHAKRIANVYRELMSRRTGATNILSGRHALITLRDLFRWASRPAAGIEQLAENGYLLLAERLRFEEEKQAVAEVIKRICRVDLDLNKLYDPWRMAQERKLIWFEAPSEITWTKPMKRLCSLVLQALLAGESVLLVGETGCGKTTVCQLIAQILKRPLQIMNLHQNTEAADIIGSLRPSRKQEGQLFEWVDGPLTQAMRKGELILLDEISLAEDSVLERLNSVLEPAGSLVLTEGTDETLIKPSAGFGLLATMNPGGDYGKKELSPALRNRFTEIWVPSIGDDEDVKAVLTSVVSQEQAETIISFISWWRSFSQEIPFLSRWVISMRDILAFARFLAKITPSLGAQQAFWHAASMLFIDPLHTKCSVDSDKLIAHVTLAIQAKLREVCGSIEVSADMIITEESFGVGPFVFPRSASGHAAFVFEAPTTQVSLLRVMRAMQLGTSLLLEGSPGVGKTTLITSLATTLGVRLTRINLSDQTDIVDLFGADLPSEKGFAWCDGPFLRAMRAGDWILLDELNLASQSVLEGLNACLDHRGRVYIPELDREFEVSPATRIFAAQNPMAQGGGRKGLPKSFVNRFVPVWIDQQSAQDYRAILSQSHRDSAFVDSLIAFNASLAEAYKNRQFGGKGGPWEFNLRDLLRLCKLAERNAADPVQLIRPLYLTRMRTAEDRQMVDQLFGQAFGGSLQLPFVYQLDGDYVQVGLFRQECPKDMIPVSLASLLPLEALGLAVQQGWLSIVVGEEALLRDEVITFLAEIFAQKPVRFSMSPDTDTLELLGSFEQIDMNLQWWRAARQAGIACEIEDAKDLLSKHENVTELLELEASLAVSPRFQWVDGPLTRALELGEWLILDSANLASPAVLDRLNSLFEPDGTVVLYEAASNPPRVLKPHPNFRMFMMVDPRFGELSRAMRNRGVEVYVSPSIFGGQEYDRVNLLRRSGADYEMAMQIASQPLNSREMLNQLAMSPMLSSANAPLPICQLSRDFAAKVQMAVAGDEFARSVLMRGPWSKFGKHASYSLDYRELAYLSTVSSSASLQDIDFDSPPDYQEPWFLFWQQHLAGLTWWPKDVEPSMQQELAGLMTIQQTSNPIEAVDLLASTRLGFGLLQDLIRQSKLDELKSVSNVLAKTCLEPKNLFVRAQLALQTLQSVSSFRLILQFGISTSDFKSTALALLSWIQANMTYDPVTEVVKPGIKSCVYRLQLNQALLQLQQSFFDYYFGGHLPDRRGFDGAVAGLSDLGKRLHGLNRERLINFVALTAEPGRVLANQGNLVNLQRLRDLLVRAYASSTDLATLPLLALDLLIIGHRQSSNFDHCLPLSHHWMNHDSVLLRCHAIRVHQAAGGAVDIQQVLASLAPMFRREVAAEADYEYKMRTEEEQEEELVQSFTGPSVVGQEVKIWNLLIQPASLTQAYSEFVDQLVEHAASSEYSDEGLRRLLLTKIRQVDAEPSQDFYEGSAAKFTAALFETLGLIRIRIASLLDLYPEHDVLLSLDSMAFRIEEMPRDSPLAAYCHSVEMWLGKAEDWQNYCKQSNSLPTEGLVTLVVEWRKLELLQWKDLFERLSQKTTEDTKRHWPWLFESCRLEAAEFASILDSFLLGTNVGELPGRLELLSKLCNHISAEKRYIIHNIMAYFDLVRQQAIEFVALRKPAIDEELKAFAVGMHWNDKTIFGLRQNVEKSRRKLGQYLRKYKEILDTPIVQLKCKMQRSKINASSATTLPGHLANELLKLDDEITSRVAELRSLTSEGHLTVKQNALLDLFRTLKSMGFNLNRMLDQPKRIDLLIKEEAGGIIPLVHHWNDFSLALHAPHDDLSPVHVKSMEAVVLHSLDFGLNLSRQVTNWRKLEEQRTKAQSEMQVAAGLDDPVTVCGLDSLQVMLQEISLMAYTSELQDEISRLQALLPSASVISSSQAQVFESLNFQGPIIGHLLDVIEPLRQQVSECKPVMTPFKPATFAMLTTNGLETQAGLDGLLGFSTAVAKPYKNLTCICQEMEALLNSWCSFACQVTSIFTGLLKEGFCRPAKASEAKEDGEEEAEGMGMADAPSAQDAKNVSGEIEFEEQVTDLQNDDPQAREAGEKREEEGLEMQNDFEAAMEELLNAEDDDPEEKREEEFGDGQDRDEDAEPNVEPVNEDWLDREEAEGKEERAGDEEASADQKDTEFGVAHTSDDDLSTGEQEMQEAADDVNDLDGQSEDDGEEGVNDAMEDDSVEDKIDNESDLEDDAAGEGEEVGEEVTPEEQEEEEVDEQGDEPPVAEHDYGHQENRESGEQEGEEDLGLEAGAQDDSEMRAEVAATTEKSGMENKAKPLEEAVKDAHQTVHEILESMTQRPMDPIDKSRLTADQLYQSTEDMDAMAVNAGHQEGDQATSSITPDRKEPKRDQRRPAMPEQVNEDLSRMKLSISVDEASEPKEVTFAEEQVCLRPWEEVLMDTAPAAFELAEQLRLILTPTRATKLRGDYRTGKRLNMRKIIQYVASQYRKDKIWLRRTKPSQRQYRICLSVDNSRSMQNGGAHHLAIDSLAMIAQALSRLEAGEMAAISFGQESRVILPFTGQVTPVQGSAMCEALSFADETTDMPGMLTLARSLLTAGDDQGTWRLNLIVSDGIFQDFEGMAALNNACLEERIVNVFVILDIQSKILEMSQVEYVKNDSGETKVLMTKYLEKFPFEFYVVVRQLDQLPLVLADALRQWFEVLESRE